jgi:hypothetical protein
MSATTIRQTEAIPATYPVADTYAHRPFENPPSGQDATDAVIDPMLIWQRIEAYVAHRWTERDVEWIVDGSGDWTPPLTPADIVTTEIWQADGWQAITLAPSPYGGFMLPGCGPYRFVGTVGGGSPPPELPEAVAEAFRRLYEYSRGIAEQFREDAAHLKEGDNEVVRGWTGKAIQLSGAADLLRPYRRA